MITQTVCLESPNATYGNANGSWPQGTPAWVGEVANFTCDDGQATKMATYNTSITCTKYGNWTVYDPEFECFDGKYL